MEIAIWPTFNYDTKQEMDIFTTYGIKDYNEIKNRYKQSFMG